MNENPIVIVGLGNPGVQYEMTRHNMGAIVVQGFTRLCGCVLKQERRFLAQFAKINLEKLGIVHLLLPMTYMNLSGEALRLYLDYYKLLPSAVIVVNDDADLEYGELRVRDQGSSGGHNGLKSVQKVLGTSEYTRLKIGIGRSKEKTNDLKDFVLDRFSKEEQEKLPSLIEEAVRVLKECVERKKLENSK